jgi:hypothetical protein
VLAGRVIATGFSKNIVRHVSLFFISLRFYRRIYDIILLGPFAVILLPRLNVEVVAECCYVTQTTHTLQPRRFVVDDV